MIIDSERNRAAYLQMVEVIRSGRAIGFVGAGVTLPLGYPTWTGLVARLAEEVRRIHGDQVEFNGQTIPLQQVLQGLKGEPLIQAQILKDNLHADYFPLMAGVFGSKGGWAGSVADLISLPFNHFLTSNYDPGLEEHHTSGTFESICLHDQQAAGHFMAHHTEDNYLRRIVHVHGKYDQPQHIILTEGDYGEYVRLPWFEPFWQIFAIAVRLVFFGFSCQDIDLLDGFRRVRMALGGNNQPVESRHFAVMDLVDPSEELASAWKLNLRYGIDPVFYPNPKEDFAEYGPFLADLKRDVGAPAVSAPAVPIAPAPPEPPAPIAGGPPPDGALLEAVDRLKQITVENLSRRQTGDLE